MDKILSFFFPLEISITDCNKANFSFDLIWPKKIIDSDKISMDEKESAKSHLNQYLKSLCINDKNELIVKNIVIIPLTRQYEGKTSITFGIAGDINDAIFCALNWVVIARYISEYIGLCFATRSAISAIMARNMSHNLGSHVLARVMREDINYHGTLVNLQAGFIHDPIVNLVQQLERTLEDIDDATDKKRINRALDYLDEINAVTGGSIGNAPNPKAEEFAQDMKILAQYLQERMDFIAMVTTDWATWYSTADLSQHLMAWFFKQRKILQYIAASENLDATYFDANGKNISREKLEKDGHFVTVKKDGKELPVKKGRHISFVVRYGKRNGEELKFEKVINFTDKSEVVSPSQKIPVMFPGGKNGWHAFFVIIEGFIRNVAKHSYSSLTEGMGKDGLSPKDYCDLEIFLDIINEGKEIDGCPCYTCRLYSNMNFQGGWNKKSGDALRMNQQIPYGANGEKGWKSYELNSKFAEPFIDDAGKMNKRNWGLSEMWISAAYLAGIPVEKISDGKDKHGFEHLTTPSVGGHLNRYQYPIYVVGEEEFLNGCDKGKPDVVGELWKCADNCNCPYASSGNFKVERKGSKAWSCKHSELIAPNWYEVFGQQYDCEVNGFRSRRCRYYYEFKLLKPQIIGLEVTGDTWNEKKDKDWGINSDSRNWEYYVFEIPPKDEKCLRYKKSEEDADKGTDIHVLMTYPVRLFAVDDDELTFEENRICRLTRSEFDELKNKGTFEAACFLQTKWLLHLANRRMKIISDNLSEKIERIDLHLLFGEAMKSSPYIPNTSPFRNTPTQNTKPSTIYIPEEPKKDKSEEKNVAAVSLVFARHANVLEKNGDNSVGYRSDLQDRDKIEKAPNIVYGEAMSGGTSYFGLAQQAFGGYKKDEDITSYLENLKFKDKDEKERVATDAEKESAKENIYQTNLEVLRLIESGLMRVVIIDERVQEAFCKATEEELTSVAQQQVFAGYLNNIKEYSQYQGNIDRLEQTGYVTLKVDMNPETKKVKKVDVKLHRGLTSSVQSNFWQCKDVPTVQFGIDYDCDILIIHQGILDKWYDTVPDGDRVKNGKSGDVKKDTIAELVQNLQSKIPYVVITSGRGKPDDIPDLVRFLPFSSFDTGPRGKVFEKHPLVQQVLSIVTKKKENRGQ